MIRHLLSACLILFAILGFADSWYLAHAALTNSALVCNIAGLDGCNVVAQSAYSHLFGIPNGVYGLVFYGLIFILGVLLYIVPKRLVYRLVAILGTIGLVASIVFLSLQFFVIKALCVYCLGSAVISLVVFIVSIWLLIHHAPKHIVPTPSV